mmetsp:Transcript_6584/g.9833  ORF Transcript_6584/g.9833 Transcript_6584/m.9833 type:complete len:125 (-) Transcript_6584:212-586(-)
MRFLKIEVLTLFLLVHIDRGGHRRSLTSTEVPTTENEARTVSSTLLHSVEVAEKAFVDAVRDEVDILFHDRDHEHARSLDNAKVTTVSAKTTTIKKVVPYEEGKEMTDLDLFTFDHYPYAWGIH